MAEEDSGLSFDNLPRDRVYVAIGTSVNGHADIAESNFRRFLNRESVPVSAALEYPAHAATGHVAIGLRARGHTTTFASACAAGLEAICWGAQSIAQGTASAAVVGGTEAPLSDFILEVFHSVGVLATWAGDPSQASRPFDARRTGLVLAEGAAVVVLEEENQARLRGASVYARVLGSASSTEGAHLRKVDPSGRIVERVIRLAVQQADVALADIDYICAHGNSMRDYDAAETAGIKLAFGTRAWNIPISSIKSMCGQALAASSAMQVVTAVLAIKHGIVPPTINYEEPDPDCDLDYVGNRARIARVRTVLILAHSLAGAHVAMIVGAPPA
jgi:3-oxoacyl-[acyl-carrier-protein] synthase II